MTAIQRFGSALNLNVHFHTLAVQGVFVDDGCGGLRFVPNPEPSEGEVEALLLATARRITRLVKRRGIDLERPQAEERVDGTRAILFEPQELIERLAALIPRPRINLLLYHGVLGPSARLRSAAVATARAPLLGGATPELSLPQDSASLPEPSASFPFDPPPRHEGPRGDQRSHWPLAGPKPVSLEPRPHTPWAELLRRTFAIDVLACPEWRASAPARDHRGWRRW